MKTLVTTIAAFSSVVLLSACASPSTPGAGASAAAKADEHAAHQAAAASSAAPSAMHDHMKDMQAMRDRMMNARTPAERQALMDEHMKTMHKGMAMMKDMQGMGGMHGKPGMAGMKDMPMDMGKRHQMMEMRMGMMQTMMEMMMQRMPGAATPPAGK